MYKTAQEENIADIVVKIGTDAIQGPDGRPDQAVLGPLVAQMATLYKEGHRVVLVSSGAVGIGRHELGWPAGERITPEDKSLAASVGQPELMGCYRSLFKGYGLCAAQVLLENRHMSNGCTNGRWTICDYFQRAFAEKKIVPIVNENDVTSLLELIPFDPRFPNVFSDNDGMGGGVAHVLGAPLFLLISSVGGVFSEDPRRDPMAILYPEINFVSSTLSPEALSINTEGKSTGGTGGMTSKLKTIREFIQAAKCGGRRASIIGKESLRNGGLLRAALGAQCAGTHFSCYHPDCHRGQPCGPMGYVCG